jgi:hypothetical protein
MEIKPQKQIYETPTLEFVGQYETLVGVSVVRVPIQLSGLEKETQ